jgi:hypothetical protein
MNETADELTIPAIVARHIWGTITPEKARYITNESQDVFLALDLEDADILYVRQAEHSISARPMWIPLSSGTWPGAPP